jgi:hypothetical protein
MLDVTVEPKATEEKIVITFYFTDELAPAETLTGAITSSFTVVKGTDGNPSAMANGSAVFDSTGKKILLPIQGGLAGNQYRIKVVSATTNASKTLARSALISIE